MALEASESYRSQELRNSMSKLSVNTGEEPETLVLQSARPSDEQLKMILSRLDARDHQPTERELANYYVKVRDFAYEEPRSTTTPTSDSDEDGSASGSRMSGDRAFTALEQHRVSGSKEVVPTRRAQGNRGSGRSQSDEHTCEESSAEHDSTLGQPSQPSASESPSQHPTKAAEASQSQTDTHRRYDLRDRTARHPPVPSPQVDTKSPTEPRYFLRSHTTLPSDGATTKAAGRSSAATSREKKRSQPDQRQRAAARSSKAQN